MAKRDPWQAPKDFELKIGLKLVQLPDTRENSTYSPKTPWDSKVIVYVVTRIETTGNGTQMVHLTAENNPRDTFANWWYDLKRRLIPLPPQPKPRPKRVKREPVSRFDREPL